jgi:hypothetical protein
MLEELTMLATLPVDAAAVKKAQDEADKAAAGDTMPPPKEKEDDPADADADRVARRGQDAPEQEKSGEEDR